MDSDELNSIAFKSSRGDLNAYPAEIFLQPLSTIFFFLYKTRI